MTPDSPVAVGYLGQPLFKLPPKVLRKKPYKPSAKLKAHWDGIRAAQNASRDALKEALEDWNRVTSKEGEAET